MPTYDYACNKCKKKFSLVQRMSEHGAKKVKCPKCASTDVAQRVTSFFTTTSKKS